MALISIILPVYNGENTILETIHSIQNQTFKDFEIIVINDGSTDKTLQILNTFSDNRLKVFTYENSERSVSRNRGIKHSIGSFIAFIDADDLWSSDKLELQFEALQNNIEAGVAYSWTSFINEEGNLLYADEPMKYCGNVYREILLDNFLASGSNILVRKDIIEAIGDFDSSLNASEDWEYNIRLAAKSKFVLVPKYQIFYRRYSNPPKSKIDIMESSTLNIIDRSFKSAPSNFQPLKRLALSNAYKFFAQLYLENENGANEASKRLVRSIYYYPMALKENAIQRLVIKLLILNLLPYKFSKSIVNFIGKKFPLVRAKN